MVDRLLINVLIMFVPIFFGQFVMLNPYTEKFSAKNEWLTGLFSGIAAILCMVFPIIFGDGYLWDLRWTPLLIASLYGGFRGGFIASFFMVFYRSLLGGGLNFYTVLIDAAVLYVCTNLVRLRFHQLNKTNKITFSVGISFLTYIFVMSTIFYDFYYFKNLAFIEKQGVWTYCSLALANILSTIIYVFFIENIVENAKGITERIEIKEKLRESEELFKVISECAQDIISYSSPNGITHYISPAVHVLLGYEPAEVIGKPAYEFWHPEDVENLSKHSFSDVDVFTCRVLHKDGHYVWFETRIKMIRNANGEIHMVLGIGRDITQRKHVEELLLKSEKLAAVGQLAASVAHEIRNPLTSLKGFIQLLQSQYGETKKDFYFDVMQNELTRIEVILSELLVLGKPQIVRYQERDLRNILTDVVTLLESQALMNNVQIITEFETVPTIQCEENQLKQVFINLIKNGIESMPTGGDLVIRLNTHLNDGILIQFIDRGVGIPKDVLEKLGEPFYTTKEKGTGLGIMVTHKIIESHQGKIEFSSIVGKGTTVNITLPVSQTVPLIKANSLP